MVKTKVTYSGFGGSLANKVPSFLTLPLSSGSESVSLSTRESILFPPVA